MVRREVIALAGLPLVVGIAALGVCRPTRVAANDRAARDVERITVNGVEVWYATLADESAGFVTYLYDPVHAHTDAALAEERTIYGDVVIHWRL